MLKSPGSPAGAPLEPTGPGAGSHARLTIPDLDPPPFKVPRPSASSAALSAEASPSRGAVFMGAASSGLSDWPLSPPMPHSGSGLEADPLMGEAAPYNWPSTPQARGLATPAPESQELIMCLDQDADWTSVLNRGDADPENWAGAINFDVPETGTGDVKTVTLSKDEVISIIKTACDVAKSVSIADRSAARKIKIVAIKQLMKPSCEASIGMERIWRAFNPKIMSKQDMGLRLLKQIFDEKAPNLNNPVRAVNSNPNAPRSEPLPPFYSVRPAIETFLKPEIKQDLDEWAKQVHRFELKGSKGQKSVHLPADAIGVYLQAVKESLEANSEHKMPLTQSKDAGSRAVLQYQFKDCEQFRGLNRDERRNLGTQILAEIAPDLQKLGSHKPKATGQRCLESDATWTSLLKPEYSRVNDWPTVFPMDLPGTDAFAVPAGVAREIIIAGCEAAKSVDRGSKNLSAAVSYKTQSMLSGQASRFPGWNSAIRPRNLNRDEKVKIVRRMFGELAPRLANPTRSRMEVRALEQPSGKPLPTELTLLSQMKEKFKSEIQRDWEAWTNKHHEFECSLGGRKKTTLLLPTAAIQVLMDGMMRARRSIGSTLGLPRSQYDRQLKHTYRIAVEHLLTYDFDARKSLLKAPHRQREDLVRQILTYCFTSHINRFSTPATNPGPSSVSRSDPSTQSTEKVRDTNPQAVQTTDMDWLMADLLDDAMGISFTDQVRALTPPPAPEQPPASRGAPLVLPPPSPAAPHRSAALDEMPFSPLGLAPDPFEAALDAAVQAVDVSDFRSGGPAFALPPTLATIPAGPSADLMQAHHAAALGYAQSTRSAAYAAPAAFEGMSSAGAYARTAPTTADRPVFAEPRPWAPPSPQTAPRSQVFERAPAPQPPAQPPGAPDLAQAHANSVALKRSQWL